LSLADAPLTLHDDGVHACGREECKPFPGELMALLEEHGAVIQPALRIKLVQALVLMRNRGLVNPTELLQLFFKLFRIQDKVKGRWRYIPCSTLYTCRQRVTIIGTMWHCIPSC
jgi:NUC130/3NT domain